MRFASLGVRVRHRWEKGARDERDAAMPQENGGGDVGILNGGGGKGGEKPNS